MNEVGGAVKDLCVFVPVRGQTVNHLFLQNSGNHSHHKSNYLYPFTYLGFSIWVLSLIYFLNILQCGLSITYEIFVVSKRYLISILVLSFRDIL